MTPDNMEQQTHQMSKKIEGFAGYDNDGSAIIGSQRNQYLSMHCTTVIHDGPPEPVFTESEVRAMMDDVKAIAADHSMKCYTNRINQMTPPAPVAFHIDNYLWKSHGLSSDPT